MAELLTIAFSVAAGIVLAGIVTNAQEIISGKRAGFSMLMESGKPVATLLTSGFLLISGPLLLLRWGRRFVKTREVAGLSMVAAGAGFWGFMTGLFMLHMYVSFTA